MVLGAFVGVDSDVGHGLRRSFVYGARWLCGQDGSGLRFFKQKRDAPSRRSRGEKNPPNPGQHLRNWVYFLCLIYFSW